MKAMILAAGKGQRMLPLTQNCPKPLLPVNGVALLERWLQKLEAVKAITHIYINAAYLGDQIQDFVRARSNKKPISVSLEPQPLETAGAINYVLEALGCEPFLLVNGDVYCDAPMALWLDETCQFMRQTKPCEGVLMMVGNPAHNPAGDYCINPDATITLPNVKHAANGPAGYTFAGISCLTPQLISTYPQKRQCFALREVFDWAISRNVLYAKPYLGYWLDVGTPERLKNLEQYLAQ